jgi:hypothetical protein
MQLRSRHSHLGAFRVRKRLAEQEALSTPPGRLSLTLEWQTRKAGKGLPGKWFEIDLRSLIETLTKNPYWS